MTGNKEENTKETIPEMVESLLTNGTDEPKPNLTNPSSACWCRKFKNASPAVIAAGVALPLLVALLAVGCYYFFSS
jgi:hypothetical protein